MIFSITLAVFGAIDQSRIKEYNLFMGFIEWNNNNIFSKIRDAQTNNQIADYLRNLDILLQQSHGGSPDTLDRVTKALFKNPNMKLNSDLLEVVSWEVEGILNSKKIQ